MRNIRKLPVALVLGLSVFTLHAQTERPLAATTLSAASPARIPVAQKLPDGFGGHYVLYEQNRIVRLQHVDASGRRWPQSVVLNFAQTANSDPRADICADGRGGVWALTYDAQIQGAEFHATVQRYAFNGIAAFPPSGKSLVLAGAIVQGLEPDMKGGFWIKTPHRSHVDANGELTSSASWRDVPEHIVNPLPSMYASADAESERYVILHADRSLARRTNLNHAAVAMNTSPKVTVPTEMASAKPFRYRRTAEELEISVALMPGEISPVSITLHNADGERVYNTAGFVSDPEMLWYIPTRQLHPGVYTLTMRLGEREQMEDLIVERR